MEGNVILEDDESNLKLVPSAEHKSSLPQNQEETKEEEKVDPRSLLTEEQIKYFKSVYAGLDAERKERVPTKAIGFVLRMMGLNPSKAELKEHMKEIDPDNKAERINQVPETHEDIIAAFKVFDEEENGYVYTDILTENLTSLAEDLDDFEMELLLKMADPKGTGKINYTEFAEKMFGIVRKRSGEKKKGEKKKGEKKQEEKKKGGKKKNK